MKLYMHPVSMTCRTVRMFIADNNIPVEEVLVDVLTGEHHKEPFSSFNPNRLVPVLEEDDGFRITESSAILKYLADKINSPAYPKDLKQRAKVNEMMDWINTQFYRDWGYGMAYPQLFPHHKRRSDEAHAGAIEWGVKNSKHWLGVLNDYFIGPKNNYLAGNQLTIADYFGAGIVTIGELVGCDFAQYPNVKRWLDTVKKQPSWSPVNEAFYGLRDAVKGKQFQRV
jgi:glutathione S-transferase